MDMGARVASGDPFVEVRSVDGINACAVIEFVRADVPDDERHATINRMLEEALQAIATALANHRTRVTMPGQRQEYRAGPRGCLNCKKKRDEHFFYCPDCKCPITSSACRVHTPVLVGLARCCELTALQDGES